MLRIDLGCGQNKQKGFIGLDHFALPGVDVVADINHGLPFRDDSVDLLVASHSLEHVADLMATMKEVYRICRHGAQLCIISPYNEQKLNWANPYHKDVFNEHTPRFWTSYPLARVDPQEFRHPQAPDWGLSTSDNSDPGIDIRIVGLEFFYFPDYLGLSTFEHRQLRKERIDICDQIMYHLVVWKRPWQGRDEAFEAFVAGLTLYEPDYISIRRNQERDILMQKTALESGQAGMAMTGLEEQLKNRRAAEDAVSGRRPDGIEELLSDRLRELRLYQQQCAAFVSTLDEKINLQNQLVEVRSALMQAKDQIERLMEAQNRTADELSHFRQEQRSTDSLKAQLAITRAELDATSTLLEMRRKAEEALIAEVSGLRIKAATAREEKQRAEKVSEGAKRLLGELGPDSRPAPLGLVRIGSFVLGRMAGVKGPPVANALRPYSDRHFPGASRACVVLSEDLSEVPYREYAVPFDVERLRSIEFAITPVVAGSGGTVGVEIVSFQSEIVAQVHLPLAGVRSSVATEFCLTPPLKDLTKTWRLRIFVRGAAGPVHVFELSRGVLFRGAAQIFPLVSFL